MSDGRARTSGGPAAHGLASLTHFGDTSLTPPEWLVALVKPKKAPVPWPAAARAAIALGLPLAICWAAGELAIGIFIALGALSGTISDRHGPYRVRALQIGLGAVCGALGFTVGEAVYGRGWITVVVLCAVALCTALAAVGGTIAATSSLQALIYTIIASGKAFPAPAWEPPLLFLVGGAWAMGLTLLGSLRDASSPERQAMVGCFEAFARLIDSLGTDQAEQRRRETTIALNDAYDALLSGRIRSGGRSPVFRRHMQLLNASTPLLESAAAATRSGRPAPPHVAPALRDIARAVAEAKPIPELPTWRADAKPAPLPESHPDYPHPTVLERIRGAIDQILSGKTTWHFALRLTICIGAAELVRQFVPTGRSYWIALTVAIVLKSDFGSVFARAVQRSGGTLVGAALGAGLLIAIPHGIWDVVAIAVLAAMLPIAIQRQYGMFTTFLTPLVILLLDLPGPRGWSILTDRIADTSIGCAIVLIFGYLLWPGSFRSRIGPRFADAAADLATYTRAALTPGAANRGALRRSAYRRLSDLRTVFQQALAEPPPVSRPASAWLPGIVALERMIDAVTRAAIRLDRGATPPPAGGVDALVAAILDLPMALAERRPPLPLELPDDPTLEELADELVTARNVIIGPVTQPT